MPCGLDIQHTSRKIVVVTRAQASAAAADSHGGVAGHSHVLKTVKHTDELCRAFDGCTLAILAALSRIELY